MIPREKGKWTLLKREINGRRVFFETSRWGIQLILLYSWNPGFQAVLFQYEYYAIAQWQSNKVISRMKFEKIGAKRTYQTSYLLFHITAQMFLSIYLYMYIYIFKNNLICFSPRYMYHCSCEAYVQHNILSDMRSIGVSMEDCKRWNNRTLNW